MKELNPLEQLLVENQNKLIEALKLLLKEARENSFYRHGNINDTPAEANAHELINLLS